MMTCQDPLKKCGSSVTSFQNTCFLGGYCLYTLIKRCIFTPKDVSISQTQSFRQTVQLYGTVYIMGVAISSRNLKYVVVPDMGAGRCLGPEGNGVSLVEGGNGGSGPPGNKEYKQSVLSKGRDNMEKEEKERARGV